MTATVSMKQALNCTDYFLSMHMPTKKEFTIQIEIEEKVQLAYMGYINAIHDALLQNIYMVSKEEAKRELKRCVETRQRVISIKHNKISNFNSVNKLYKEMADKFIKIVDAIEMIANSDKVDETSKDYIEYWANMIDKNRKKKEKRVYGIDNVLKLMD